VQALSVRLIVLQRPLLGPTSRIEEPDYTHSWYKRIAETLAWPVKSWRHKHMAVGDVQVREETNVLSSLLELIQPVPDGEDHTLVLDLSAYRCRAPAWDALAELWYDKMRPFSWVVVILDPYAGALNSVCLKKLYVKRKGETGLFVVMDSEGCLYELDRAGDTRGVVQAGLSQHAERMTEGDFRRAVSFGPNRSFGHFQLPSGAHVRTHYDLYSLVADRRAYRFILRKVQDLMHSSPFDLIVGFGLGSVGLTCLCDKLGPDLGIPSLFCSASTKEALQREIAKGSRRVLLLSDLVLTGKTAKGLVSTVHTLQGEVTSVLAVIGLANSAERIDGIPVTFCIRLKRSFYPNTESCELCQADASKPLPVANEEAFREGMLSNRCPDYDFWELLKETDAFQIGHQESPNGINHYFARVETERLLSNYGDFVASVLAAQARSALGEECPADQIACPNERGALYLAYSLAKELHIPARRVIAVDRSDIERCPPGGVAKDVVDRYEQQFELDRGVLAVDDGCNSLHTFKHLIGLLRAVGAVVKGYAIFLNALDERGIDEAVSMLGRGFFYFHRWRLGPFTRGHCSVCVGSRARAVSISVGS